jgi:hypothetical protein
MLTADVDLLEEVKKLDSAKDRKHGLKETFPSL